MGETKFDGGYVESQGAAALADQSTSLTFVRGGKTAQNCAFPASLVKDVTLTILQASNVVLYVDQEAHDECTPKISRALHGAGVSVLSLKHVAADDTGLSLSSTLDAHAFELSRLDLLCFVPSLQSPQMIQLHKAVSSSVLYRFFRFIVFLPAASQPSENSLGSCRLLAITPLQGDQTVFNVKRTDLLSENCTKLNTYAQWKDKTGFDRPVSKLELSPIVRNYRRKQLLVGYVEYSPFSVSRRPNLNGTVVYEGVDFSLISNLARVFNMR
ncbi:uncharacterized protein LOC142817219 [Rhipicephalus microplus]|uniref:uncharacterized protein LOC142817219 n=1 Tax=Rhipicephalus microplus TaxID=6941 RepID=UPI003F6A76FC